MTGGAETPCAFVFQIALGRDRISIKILFTNTEGGGIEVGTVLKIIVRQ